MTSAPSLDSSPGILLRGGTLLIHDDKLHVHPTVSDLLVKDGIIAKIGNNIDVSGQDIKEIDCSGKIISPGFINTHHHLYQSQLKGKHGDHNLVGYFPAGHFVGSCYRIEDAFWGQLAAAMEAIDAGTTTVVDHSGLNLLAADYPKTLIQALATSGLRTIYCYTATRVVTSWTPLAWQDDYSSPQFLDTFEELAAAGPFGGPRGRVKLGYAIDNLYLPAALMQSIFSRVRAAGAHLITTHGSGGPMFNNPPSALQLLDRHGLLGSDVLVSHGNYPSAEDPALLRAHGAHISATPNTELQMGWAPLGLRPEFAGHTSLGVDCHSLGTGFMPGQMRLALQFARFERSQAYAREDGGGRWSRHVGPTAEDAFNLGTVAGARAIGMAGRVGRIAEGYVADLVVFRTDSPSMLGAAEENPVAAVVMHSSERDVDVVIVDGVVRKEGGVLLDVIGAPKLSGAPDLGIGGKKLAWDDVAAALKASRQALNEITDKIDMRAAEESVMKGFYMALDRMVEKE